MSKYTITLRNVEERIEGYYLRLVKLEKQGLDGLEYENILRLLFGTVLEEKRLADVLNSEEIKELYGEVVGSQDILQPFALGHFANAIDSRIYYLSSVLIGDELCDYACYLRYDLNQIILALLNSLIKNDYYAEIRDDLIDYKYNLLFLNIKNESDFLNGNSGTIAFESQHYDPRNYPSVRYVNQAMLVLEGREYLDRLLSIQEGSFDDKSKYALAVISLLEVLSRLVLCDKKMLLHLKEHFDLLCYDEAVPIELKSLIQELYVILDSLKDSIINAR